MNRGVEGDDRESERRRVVQTRIALGTERIQRLRTEVDASDNVVQERAFLLRGRTVRDRGAGWAFCMLPGSRRALLMVR